MLLIVVLVGLDLSGLQFLLVVLLFGGFGFGWGLHSFVVVSCRFAVPVVDGGCLVCMFAGLGCFLLLFVGCCLFVLWFVWLCVRLSQLLLGVLAVCGYRGLFVIVGAVLIVLL